jgi:hypothetical protein
MNSNAAICLIPPTAISPDINTSERRYVAAADVTTTTGAHRRPVSSSKICSSVSLKEKMAGTVFY